MGFSAAAGANLTGAQILKNQEGFSECQAKIMKDTKSLNSNVEDLTTKVVEFHNELKSLLDQETRENNEREKAGEEEQRKKGKTFSFPHDTIFIQFSGLMNIR